MPAQARKRRTCARRANLRRSSSVTSPQNFALVYFCPLLYYAQNLGTTVIQKSFLIPATLMVRLHSLSRDSLFWFFSEGSEILYPELSPARFLTSASVLEYDNSWLWKVYSYLIFWPSYFTPLWTGKWLISSCKLSFPVLYTTGNLPKLRFLHCFVAFLLTSRLSQQKKSENKASV